MISLIRWIIGFILTVLVATFAAINRDSVPVVWNIFDNSSIELPLYAVVLGSIVFGFIFGGLVVWFNGAGVRRDRRRKKREIKVLEKELKSLRDGKAAEMSAPTTEILPALPNAKS